MLKFKLTDDIMGSELVSVRLQNAIRRITLRNCTFEDLLQVKETLLKRIDGIRTKAELEDVLNQVTKKKEFEIKLKKAIDK